MLFGRSRCATKRTSGLSMPMPNAMVATITTPSSLMKRSWLRARRLGVEAGVIGQRRDAGLGQRGRGVLDLGARQAIDDAGVAGVALAMKALSCGRRVLLVDDFIADVRAVETRDKARRVGKPRAARRSPGGCSSSAVAVSAMRGTSGKRSAITDRPIYSGRKSWPHCDTQCASSIANSAILRAVEQDEAARRQQPLGRDVEQVEIAGEQPLLDRGGLVVATASSSAPPP